MPQVNVKCKIEVDGLNKVQDLIRQLQKTISTAQTLIGQISSASISATIDVPAMKERASKRL